MTDTLDRLTAALADRYAIEQELGAGGMRPRISRKQTDRNTEEVR